MTKFLRLILMIALLSAMVGPATAYQTSYDNNCKEREETEEIKAGEEVASIDPIFELGFKLKQKTCKGVDFLRKLFTKEPDPYKIDADMVFEASKPEVDPVKVTQEYLKKERQAEERIKAREERERIEYLRSNPANDFAKERAERDEAESFLARAREPLVPPLPLSEPVILPPAKQGGFIQIFQARNGPAPKASADGQPPKAADIDGEGVLISEDGIQRGTFKDSLLDGAGEEITSEGTWRGGNYQDGEIEGQGFEVGEQDGKLYVTEGNFVDDEPDGTVTMSYSDGTSQRVIWKDGKPVAYGQMAAVGKTPVDPVYKSPEQLAAEADAAFDASLASAPSAGALYALADELEEKGDDAKARKAYRAILTRFPSSPLAEKAADRLANGSKSASAPSGSGSGGGSGGKMATGGAPGPQVVYGSLVPQPMLWRSFYDRMNRMTAAECKPNGMENDAEVAELLRFLNQAQSLSLQDQIRTIAASHEASLISLVRCSPSDPGIEQSKAAFFQTLQTCEQTASNPAACHTPLK